MLGLLVALMGVAACSSSVHSDLESFVAEVKARKAGRIPPLPEVKTYEPHAYSKGGLNNPFKPAEEDAVAENVGSELQPDVERNREPLEAFPLDSLVFGGNIEQAGRIWALITAPDGLVYRVEKGNYVGQNFGRITRISETQIAVREIIGNGMGGWTERESSLVLTE